MTAVTDPRGPAPQRPPPDRITARPKLKLRDLLSECLASLLARPARAVLTVLGTVVGVAALVATLGLSKTAGNQIVGRFDELAATDIVVTPKAGTTGRAVKLDALPWDAEARAKRLNGVVAAGTLSDVDLRGDLVRAVPVNDPQGQTQFQMPVKAASSGLFRAVRAQLQQGRLFDDGHSLRADRVAVLGPNAAEQLHITRVDNQPAIYLGDQLYVVVGLLDSVGRQPALLGSVIIPEGTAQREFGLTAPSSVQVETRVGAAGVIANQLPLALSPADPTVLKVVAPPEPRRVRAGVQHDLDTLFLLLGGVSLAGRGHRHRQRHARLRARAGGRDRPAPLARRRPPPHRRAVPAREHHARPPRRHPRRRAGDAGRGDRGRRLARGRRSWRAGCPSARRSSARSSGCLAGIYPSMRAAALEPVDALRASL